jgi:hypothetical protein
MVEQSGRGFVPPVFDDVSQSGAQFHGQLDNAWAVPADNRSLWSKGKDITGKIFIATSPFVKHFLLVAKDGARVRVL